MGIKWEIYTRLPEVYRPKVESIYRDVLNKCKTEYRRLHPNHRTDKELHAAFVEYFFQSREEYMSFVSEFEEGGVMETREQAFEKYQRMTGNKKMGAIEMSTARDYYALIRKLEPDIVIETGVCNGVSTLSILLAFAENNAGRLYSIDYPFRADESLDQFREETFEEYGGSAIPSNKDPGWIVPADLQDRWDLTIGKSQRELPRLLADMESIDLFIHDSEHSHPCMMFEYAIAYEWLEPGGVLLSDDIDWNDAFSVFTDVRDPEYGKLSNGVGYMCKPK